MKYKDRLSAKELATVRFWAVFRKLIALGSIANEHEAESALTKAHEMLREKGYVVRDIPSPINTIRGLHGESPNASIPQKKTKPVDLAGKTMFDELKIKQRNRVREDNLAKRTLDTILEIKR